MMGKWWLRVLVGLLALVVVMVGGQGNQQLGDAQAATGIPGKGSPSGTPIGIFGFYFTTGFSLQPENRYTSVNRSVMLTTTTAHSILGSVDPFAIDHFQWYQSTNDGKTWQSLNSDQKADLTITPTQAGTVYYQQSFQYYYLSSFLAPIYYSRVAAVTTFPQPIPATGLKVTSDQSYLYNNQRNAMVTYVHGTPTPATATGKLTWTSSDDQLATVNEATGEVKANTSGQSGTVVITGTMTNDDGSTETDQAAIEVGGGLVVEQQVAEGQTATFSVQGSFAEAPSTVVWHRIMGGKDSVVTSENKLSYTTLATSMADDQAQYYAVVTIKAPDGSMQNMTTNRSKLTVIPDTTPKVTITNQVADVTDNTGNTTSELTNILSGDTCKVTGSFSDDNPYSKLTDGEFLITLPTGVQPDITVDGQEAHFGKYPSGDNMKVLVTGVDFSKTKTHTFSVTFTSNQTDNRTMKTWVDLSGEDAQHNKINTYSGAPLTLKFTDGKLHAVANDVNFGEITTTNLGQEIPGIATGDGDLLDVTDNRRHKTATTIDLRQETPFSNGQTTLTAGLSYDDGLGLSSLLTNADQTVASVASGMPVPSIGKSHGENLKVKVATPDFLPGKYTSQLDWTFVTAP
ncbi:hypothetical protein [Levilactobacillus fuyuanensis]|uniref:Ig-like domain (Group 2) n=1 Tax=Levilactobacillus fuyuanensis TaxID=2486022 RepID=A0ABW4H1U6_9LACO|nr:hypothetical protein [Levilactobacillus fuyuanensis]